MERSNGVKPATKVSLTSSLLVGMCIRCVVGVIVLVNVLCMVIKSRSNGRNGLLNRPVVIAQTESKSGARPELSGTWQSAMFIMLHGENHDEGDSTCCPYRRSGRGGLSCHSASRKEWIRVVWYLPSDIASRRWAGPRKITLRASCTYNPCNVVIMAGVAV